MPYGLLQVINRHSIVSRQDIARNRAETGRHCIIIFGAGLWASFIRDWLGWASLWLYVDLAFFDGAVAGDLTGGLWRARL